MGRHGEFAAALCCAMAIGAGLAASPARAAYTVERISVGVAGQEADGFSDSAGVTPDGRYVVFRSAASNLVEGDTNGVEDIFVRDRLLGTTERVSVSSAGAEANGTSTTEGGISADGRYVVFDSSATNLVSDDTYGVWDVFVRDRQLGTTTRVSVDSNGSQANGMSWYGTISSCGRYVVFSSYATNLVEGDTNGVLDGFLHDLQTHTTERVTLASGGSEGDGGSYAMNVTPGGRYVGLLTRATNLFADDTNGMADAAVRDRQSGTTTCVSCTAGGELGDGNSTTAALDPSGRYAVFDTLATNLVPGDTNGCRDVFVKDLVTGEITCVSRTGGGEWGDGDSGNPSISADGGSVVFWSDATNFAAGDSNETSDVFVCHWQLGGLTCASLVTGGGGTGNSASYTWYRNNNSNASVVVFASDASDLVPGDTNGWVDVFAATAAPLAVRWPR